MKTPKLFAIALLTACGLALAITSARIAIADTATAPPEMKLPAGWTMEDMQKMMAAGTLGEMHERLAADVGTWKCQTTMWMSPDSEPVKSEGVSVVTPIMDGRYIQVDMKGEMPGLGPYEGRGTYGFDNVSKKFVATWLDNCSTGMMTGTGKLSDDGKTITWTYTGNCPIQGGPITMRDVETTTGPNSKVMESFGPDRKTGKEFKVMRIEMTRAE
jgi:hypothetical protein